MNDAYEDLRGRHLNDGYGRFYDMTAHKRAIKPTIWPFRLLTHPGDRPRPAHAARASLAVFGQTTAQNRAPPDARAYRARRPSPGRSRAPPSRALFQAGHKQDRPRWRGMQEG